MVQTSAEAAQRLTSWTDDLPVCSSSGLGSSTNELYRRDGRRTEMHPAEDRTFRFAKDGDAVCVYGVFDGFSGPEVADFASKKFPAELLLDQLTPDSDEKCVRKILSDTFEAIDREFFQSISEHLMSRMVMLEDKRVPHDNPRLQALEKVTLTGASATVAILLDENRLNVAYVGDTRAVVASRRPSDSSIRALQLTVDHVIGSNQDEALRLSQLGLDIGSAFCSLGNHGYTRCLGYHKVKGGYKERDLMQKVVDEPVQAFPDHQYLRVEPHHLFLLIYTRSLADCMARVLDTQDPQEIADELCALTFKQFSANTTVSSVAQSTVDKIVLMHHEVFETSALPASSASETLRREDISLLVRNFHATLATRGQNYRNSGAFSDGGGEDLNTITSDIAGGLSVGGGGGPGGLVGRLGGQVTRSSTTTEDSSESHHNDNDSERRTIDAYVDFSFFNDRWQQQPDNVRRRVAHILNRSQENGDIR